MTRSTERKDSMAGGGKVGFVSLGCPKALVDTEAIIGELHADGYRTVADYAEADVVVVNTCGFIDSAVEESLAAIEQALDENGRVIVTGCLGARSEALGSVREQLLHVSGPQAVAEVADAVRSWVPAVGGSAADLGYTTLYGERHGERALLTPPHYAYLKISEGCNHRCSFCIIPSMRGKLRSRTVAENLQEAEQLARRGVRELLVVSQDTSAYGADIRYANAQHHGRSLRSDLPTLGRELGALFDWVRLHYVYPYPNVDALLPLMNEGALVPYLDVPLQHGHPDILKAMRRPAASERTLDRLTNWRVQVPELVLRSTFIVGFPGETEAHFRYLLEFLEAAQLDRVGAFTYSNVDGAAAQALAMQVSEEEKQERLARFMAVQQDISRKRLARHVGQRMRVLVDALVSEPAGTRAVARTSGDAPEIDGVVHVADARGLRAGEFAWVEIVSADDHDLHGESVGEALNWSG